MKKIKVVFFTILVIIGFRFIGDKKVYRNICSFKSDLIDKYGGCFPEECKGHEKN